MENSATRPRLDLHVLDALRGLAALYVVVFHARVWLWMVDIVPQGGLGHRLLGDLWEGAQFGPQAVLLFFLISGFCIHYRQAQTLARRPSPQRAMSLPIHLGGYAWRRVRRLYPPLLVALAITAVFDYLGSRVNFLFYAGQSQSEGFNTYLVKISDHSWWTLLGNLSLQAALGFHVFGTDTPLWSLSYEFWFYALYPIVLLAAWRVGARGTLWFVGAVAAVSLLVLLQDKTWTGFCTGTCTPTWVFSVLTYWIVWAVGAFIAEAYVGRVRLSGLRFIAPVSLLAIIFLAVNLLHPLVQINDVVSDLLWSANLAVLLAWLLLSCPAMLAPWVARGACWLSPLGNISYSLYLVHMPWIMFLSAAWLSAHDRLPAGIELALVGVLGAVCLGGVCWFLVERHFVSPRQTQPWQAWLWPQSEPVRPEVRQSNSAGVGGLG